VNQLTPQPACVLARLCSADGWEMQSTLADGSPSRHAGFSLIEVAVAIALLSIAAAFSLPGLNHLANPAPRSEVVALSAQPGNAAQTAPLKHPASSAAPASAAAKGKILKLMLGYREPRTNGGTVLTDWGGFATNADAVSSNKCGVTAQMPGSTAAVTNLAARGC
jgi:prepilin-type N-terminal cleavage/methylation domain-containing protein